MKMESDFHMVNADGETSYTKNSRLQEKALFETKPVREKAVAEVCDVIHPRILVVADLGCGSGKNTLVFPSEVINATRGRHVELQFFLNDLPGSDFNSIFQSFEELKNSAATAHEGVRLTPFHIAGVPGSYYTRLFPSQTVHLFHSSFSLHWHSQFPYGLDGNEGNIYIARGTPPYVVKLYQEQFKKDLMLFLELRYEELASGGQMLLNFLGRKNDDVYSGDLNCLYGLISQSLQSLVEKDLVNQKDLDSFNLPIYGASVGEVNEVLNQSGLFDINHIKSFDLNWDPYNDSEDNNVQDSIQSGVNIAKSLRAVMETLFVSHFGESVLNALFEELGNKLADYLQHGDNPKYSVIVVSLNKK